VSREDKLDSKISAGAVAGAADLVRSPLRSRSAVPRSRSAPLRPIFLGPAHRSAPLRSTRVLARSAPFSAPLTLLSHALLERGRQMSVGWSKMEIFASFTRSIFRIFTSKATFIILCYVAP